MGGKRRPKAFAFPFPTLDFSTSPCHRFSGIRGGGPCLPFECWFPIHRHSVTFTLPPLSLHKFLATRGPRVPGRGGKLEADEEASGPARPD